MQVGRKPGVCTLRRKHVGRGVRLQPDPGVAARTFATVRELGVEPKFVATSPIKIAFYLPHDDVEKAVRALHDAFELGSPEAERQHA